MEIPFRKMYVQMQFPSQPFKSEIEYALNNYADMNNIIIEDSQRFEMFYEDKPDYRFNRPKVVFFGREKTQDEILGSQIESQIKFLEE